MRTDAVLDAMGVTGNWIINPTFSKRHYSSQTFSVATPFFSSRCKSSTSTMKFLAIYFLAYVCVTVSAFSSTQSVNRRDVSLAMSDKDSDFMRWARSARSAGRYESQTNGGRTCHQFFVLTFLYLISFDLLSDMPLPCVDGTFWFLAMTMSLNFWNPWDLFWIKMPMAMFTLKL